MTDIETYLIEWREARKAFLAIDHSQPATYVARKPLFDRLANAECALMAAAKELPRRTGAEPTAAEVLAACFNPDTPLADAQAAERDEP